jgi:poly(3-hydroxybutyrate) depolymerase
MRCISLFAIGLGLLGPACRCVRSSNAATLLTPNGVDASVCSGGRESVSAASHTTPSGRTFHVWTPAHYDGAKPMAVVFALHGRGSDGLGFQDWFKMESFTEESAIVVYPDARQGLWDIHGDTDLEFFDEMIDGLASAYCVDRARVFAIGFSYGGKMVHHLGCKRAGRFKGISVGDGSWIDRASTCDRLPVLVTHRTRDHDELFTWGKDAAEWWSKVNGCSPHTEETDAEHGCFGWKGCAAGASVTFCEDRYFNAAWPRDWNHTVREEYLKLTWRWFASLH